MFFVTSTDVADGTKTFSVASFFLGTYQEYLHTEKQCNLGSQCLQQ